MKRYVSTINNYKLLDYELKVFIKAELETGLKGKDLIKFIKNENALQLKRQNMQLYNLLIKRLELLSPDLKELMLGLQEDRLVICLCLILHTNDLFFDFFGEEISKETKNYGGIYEKHRIKIFFERLKEQGLINWTDGTTDATLKCILNTLIKAKILNKKNTSVSKLTLDGKLKSKLKDSFQKELNLFS